MRKGQIKILEYAHKYGYSNSCIEVLSREDLTLKQLNILLSLLSYFKDKEDDWVKIFTSINDYELMRLIVRYYSFNEDVDISVDELLHMTTKENICKYFSKENVICKNLFDVELMMTIGEHTYTTALFNFAKKLKNRIDEKKYYYYNFFAILEQIHNCLEYIDNFNEFLDGIDIDSIYNNQSECDIMSMNYLNDYIATYAKNHTLFSLNNAKGIPQDILNIDFHGYLTSIKANGYFRTVDYSYPQAVYITYAPFNEIFVSKNGTLKTNMINKQCKKLIFSNKTHEFISGYMTKNGYRYKPTQLRELFFAISIYDTEEDKQNAQSVVNFLCNKYNTYIFKDLYKDFLLSGGLLLPILISEVAKYRTKKELFNNFYHMPISGDWNKKNANLTYLLLKLSPRMTKTAISRAMQCTNIPKIKKIGKKRYKMLYMLYEAVYNVSIDNPSNENCLLADALHEEYELKKIKLIPENQTINEHNQRQRNGEFWRATEKFKIKKDTKFKKLIDSMPKSYELIKTPKRLVQESINQHNCVSNYSMEIKNDYCMIYSTIYEQERHTIEIVLENGLYKVAQCFKACNRMPNKELMKSLQDTMNQINSI